MKKAVAKVTHAQLTLGVAVALAALGLVACGGSGSSSSSGSAKSAASQDTTSSAGLTPPGTELELGRSAKVSWVPPGSFEPSKAQSGIELEVAVKAIEEGSTGDLKNIELEPDEQGAVPFYVHLQLKAPSGAATPAEEDPAYSFEAIDDRDQEQASVTFIGSFPTCEETQAPHPFDGGASYETCLTYLMKGGGSIQKVEWNSGPAKANEVTPYFEHPIVWAKGNS